MYANVEGMDTDAYDFMGDIVIDFDVLSISNQGAYLQLYDNSEEHTYFNKPLGSQGIGATAGSHVQITVTDGLVEVYVDGVKNTDCTVQTTFTGPYRIGFRGYQNWSFKFTNFNIGGF